LGPALRYDFYGREAIPRPAGLGRFAAGKWKFPVKGPEKDEPAKERPESSFGFCEDLAVVGDHLLYATAVGVYSGPRPWKLLASGPAQLLPAKDGKGVDIVRAVKSSSETGRTKYQRALYDGKVTKLSFQDIKGEGEDAYGGIFFGTGPSIPPKQLESPSAFWFFADGQIVRVDRKILVRAARQP
jgi:hypothetical protein